MLNVAPDTAFSGAVQSGAEQPRHECSIARDWQIGQQQEYGAADSERCGHDEAVTQGGNGTDFREPAHELDEFVEEFLLIHFHSPLQ